jgi:hemerythrin-like domain-containing protein
MDNFGRTSRRRLLAHGAVALAGLTGFGSETLSAAQKKRVEEVSPPEDLMREHGALNRILLIYDEARTRIDSRNDFPPEVLRSAAGIVRRFVEDYHEKLEEDHVFPRFEKAGKLTDLVRTLRDQHQAGRRLTDEIERRSTLAALKDPGQAHELSELLRLFNRMYRPHEAREDTILFPAFHALVTPSEFDALGDQFEKKENELFGEEGFERIVGQIAELEKKVGLYDLAQFTPKVTSAK